MLNLPKIAVTGGLSCGKTTVCHLFQQLGAYTVSADEMVHQLLTPDSEPGQKVIEWLGPTVLCAGKIDRKRVAALIFSDPQKVKKIESLLHPLVRTTIQQAYDHAKNRSLYSLFVAEIPLLFEAAMEKDFDAVVTVVADPTLAQKRYKGSPEDFNQRNAFQLPLKEKMEKSQFILFNNGSQEELKSEVLKIYNQLKSHES